jgi:hypothetical protein
MTGEAWREWCERLKTAGEALLGDGFPTDPRERAEGFRYLTRLMVHASQLELEAGDPLHPTFVRYETPHNQWGGPNPDNIYLRANIDPTRSYRLWANVKGMRQVILSLNEGDMQLGEYGVFSERTLDDLTVDPDGRLEIHISPDAQPGNWMPMDAKARLLTIRIYQSDWERDAAPVFHIERSDAAGVPPPPLEPAFVARALGRAGRWVEASTHFWNRYTAEGWKRASPNVPSPAQAAPGGADNILYGSCFWELAPAQALLLTCDAPDADYWNFTLHTLAWLESGDFADRQTSLNGHQLHADGDGRVRLVLAHSDPGTPNWIDIGGRERGLLVYRWVWARSNPLPEAQVVALPGLPAALPADHPQISPDERRVRLARRREAAWNRFQ